MSISLLDRCASSAGRTAAAAAALVRGPRLSILIFHRVLPEPDPIFPAEIDARRFERLMTIVMNAFRVLPLDQAAAMLAHGSLPSRALAITFDDGYADNHAVALPILERLGIRATFFIATGFIDGGRMWNDTVIECLRRTRVDRVDLSALGLAVLPTSTVPERRAAIERLLSLIKYRAPEEREPLLEQLHGLCGHPDLPSDLMMSSDDVRALRRSGMLIGAHTIYHPILCTLPDAVAEAEMAGGRDRLEAMIDGPVRLFAYPNGQPGVDFDGRHVAMARRLGFAAAVSTRRGVARAGDDLFDLPRFTPWATNTARWTAGLVRHHAVS